MTFPADIHTHHLPHTPGAAIVNHFPSTFAVETGHWYSVGIHPRYIPVDNDSNIRYAMENLAFRAEHPQVLAIGEAGLDKLTSTPMAIQIKVFEQQALLSMDLDKPLIIHLVKATDELLKLKSHLRPANPWIIHGFRGKATLAQEYLKHGFYLSFGEKYQVEALQVTPSERLFLETDESHTPAEELYRRASEMRGTSLDKFTEAIRKNIRNVFFKKEEPAKT